MTLATGYMAHTYTNATGAIVDNATAYRRQPNGTLLEVENEPYGYRIVTECSICCLEHPPRTRCRKQRPSAPRPNCVYCEDCRTAVAEVWSNWLPADRRVYTWTTRLDEGGKHTTYDGALADALQAAELEGYCCECGRTP